MTNPSSGDDPRIEEMTADQPADLPNASFCSWCCNYHPTDAHAACRVNVRRGLGPDGQSLGEDDGHLCICTIEFRPCPVHGKSAAASSVPGLSVCVAQLAAIRQLRELCMLYGGEKNWMPIRQVLAVLDGVPGTTQPRIEGNEADLR